MRQLELTPELQEAITRCIWFEPAERAIQNTAKLTAHILTYGSIGDVKALRAQLSDAELKRALDNAPAGIFDARSWAYWHLCMGQRTPPPMPMRKLPA